MFVHMHVLCIDGFGLRLCLCVLLGYFYSFLIFIACNAILRVGVEVLPSVTDEARKVVEQTNSSKA